MATIIESQSGKRSITCFQILSNDPDFRASQKQENVLKTAEELHCGIREKVSSTWLHHVSLLIVTWILVSVMIFWS